MKPHPKTGRTIEQEAVHLARQCVALGGNQASMAALITAALKRYARQGFLSDAGETAKDFLEWFSVAYRTSLGANYLVNWPKDTQIVKALLAVVTYAELQACARLLLSKRTTDRFIRDSDRSVGILKIRFNWLNRQRTEQIAPTNGARLKWDSQYLASAKEHLDRLGACPHSPRCESRADCVLAVVATLRSNDEYANL